MLSSLALKNPLRIWRYLNTISTSWGDGGYGEGLGTGRSDSGGIRIEVREDTMYRHKESMTRNRISGVRVTENVDS